MKLKQWLIAGVIMTGITTAGWAVVGSDSIYANYRERDIKVDISSELVELDNELLENREAWLYCHGLQVGDQDKDSISFDDAVKLFAGCIEIFPTLYEEVRPGEKFSARVKPYVYRYDSTRSVSGVGDDLNSLIERNGELTKANVRIVILAHSEAGNVVQAYQRASGGRKLVRVVTLDSPFLGALAADPEALTESFVNLYPAFGVGATLAELSKSRVDFEMPVMKWLKPNNEMLLSLHQESPLNDKWVLYGGVIQPKKGNIFTIVQLADALWLGQNSAEVSRHYCPTGAALIEASGDMSGSDGLVSLRSAWAQGYANGVRTRLLIDYNHAEVLQGKGGELELYRKILWDLVTFPPLHNPEPTFGNLDFQLPSTELFNVPRDNEEDFSASRRVWIENGQIVVSADVLNDNVLGPGSKQLTSNWNVFSWPTWHNDDVLVTQDVGGFKDLVLITTNGRVFQLTTDGRSRMADCGNNGSLIVYVADNQLLVRTPDGMTRIVVAERLDIDIPPVLWGNKIYFANKDDTGVYNLRWVSKDAQHYTLGNTKMVSKSTCNPIKVESPWGNLLLAFRIVGEDVELTAILDDKWSVGRKTFNGLIENLNPYLNGLNLSTQTQVAMDSKTGYLYIEHDGEIRQLDTLKFLSKIGPWFQQGTVDPSDIDEILPVIATGKHLDVK